MSLRHFKIVLQLKLRERHIQNATKLHEIFYHDDEELCQSVVKEVLHCNGEGVLLILDGFDEMPTSVVRNQCMIMRLISVECIPKATLLITSRPSALDRKKIFPKDHRHIEILGFTNEHKLRFAKTAFESEPDVFVHFRNFIFSNPIINSLMYIPINCAIIAQVFKDIRSSRKLMPETMTQLYIILVLVLIRRHMIEKGKWDEYSRIPNNLEDLPKEVLTDLKRVSELAYRGLKEEDVQVAFSDEDVGEDFQHLGLLTEAKMLYVYEGAKSSYSFPHLSLQEFLAAWHLACNPALIPDDFFAYPMLNALILKFLAGLLGCSEFPLDQMAILIPFTMVNCLYEAQQSCKSLEGCVLPDCMSFYSTLPLDMHVFGYVLVHAHIQWHLTISVHSDVSKLVDSCKNYGNVKGSISKLTVGNCFSTSCSLSIPAKLPTCLLERVAELDVQSFHYLSFRSIPINWMSSLHNLHTLSLSKLCDQKDSFLLYQTIRSYSKLRIFHFTFSAIPTVKEIKELSECIAGCHTLDHVSLESNPFYSDSSDSGSDSDSNCGEMPPPLHELFELRCLVEAALSCSTLKTLSTNIPFLAFTGSVSQNLKSIIFTVSPHTILSDKALFGCLCCIADMCRMPSMRSLEIIYWDDKYLYAVDDFLVILNHSLHCNSSFNNLELHLHLSSNYSRSTFSNVLRTHPSLLSWNCSKFIDDVDDSFIDDNSFLIDHNMPEDASDCENNNTVPTDCIFYSPGHPVRNLASFRIGDRWQSCPDLLQMQSLHNMHPLLQRALGCETLYYDKNKWDVYRILQHRSSAKPSIK